MKQVETCDCRELGKAKYIGRGFLCEHNNLKMKHPHLIPEWHEDNEPMESYLSASHSKVWWVCSSENNCGCHIWQATINKRTRTKSTGCPFCSNLRLCDHNNLETLFPHLKDEWDPDNQKKMWEYPPHSGEKVNWICSSKKNCGCHKWIASIDSRTRTNGKNTNCPYCAGKMVCVHNNLELLCDRLKIEWHPDNGPMSSYSYGSNKKVKWICSSKNNCGCHIWDTSINHRTGTDETDCPFCNGNALCIHNNLKTLRPDLENEWHPKNKDMSSYALGSNSKVLWSCSINREHEWSAFIYNRTKKEKPTGCPHCANVKQYSKAEIEWLKEIEEKEGIIIRKATDPEGQYKIGIFSVDGVCFSNNTVYEFYGNIFHGNPSIYDRQDISPISGETYGDIYDRTIARENKIKALGYKLIVKWETDFDKDDILPSNIQYLRMTSANEIENVELDSSKLLFH